MNHCRRHHHCVLKIGIADITILSNIMATLLPVPFQSGQAANGLLDQLTQGEFETGSCYNSDQVDGTELGLIDGDIMYRDVGQVFPSLSCRIPRLKFKLKQNA